MTVVRKTFNGRVDIQRQNEAELNQAISDLEERGYELVGRGSEESDHKRYNYKERKGQKYRYADSEVQRKCWAVMRKVIPG